MPDAIIDGLATLIHTERQEVFERVDVRGCNVRIGRQVAERVERCRRVAPFLPAELHVVIERVCTRRRDVGTHYTVHIDAAGPTGQRWASAWSTNFQLPSAMKFMVLTQITLPIEPNGGRHVYSVRLDGSHERFDIPLDVLMQ